MEEKSGSLRGDLIKWAREEQRLTMRWVADHGGPCLGYQSEVEKQKKAEVRWGKLTPWIRALNVNEPFVRGNLPRYIDDPAGCRGLAADVGQAVRDSGEDWAALTFGDRAREVLCRVSRDSQKLPRVVLAYVLSLQLESLDALMSGRIPFVPFQVRALADLTALPERFFTHGTLESLVAEETADYTAVLEVARRRGLTPDKLLKLIEA